MTLATRSILAAALVASTSFAHAADLKVSFADPAWDGKKVPADQQCHKFGGHGATPRLKVADIPAKATALEFWYSDRTYTPMDKGGHGVVAFALKPGTTSADVPSVPGNVETVPAGFSVVSMHKAPTWDTAGAYLPPCSGGKGNSYYVTVRAMAGSEVLGTGTLELGKY